MIYNIIGLAFDLVGVLLLFRFGILPNNLWNHILMDSGMSDEDEKQHKIWSKIAIALIFIGFSLQLAGSIIQNQQVNNDLVIEKEGSFGINLEDNAGFKISKINEEFKANSNLFTVISGDSLSVTIKNSIPYSKKNYKQIDKWKLTIRR